MTGILAECCNDRMLSDSIMEKKGGISGYVSTEKTVTAKEQERNKKGKHASRVSFILLYMFNKRVFSQVHKSYKSCFIPLRLIVY